MQETAAKKDLLRNFFYYTLCWVIALSIGFYFRLYPLFYHTSDTAYDKATLMVLAKLRSTSKQQVEQNYSNLPKAQRNQIAKENFDRLLHINRENVISGISEAAKKLTKENPPLRPYPYLLEADPYNFYSLTERLATTGALGADVKGSKFLNARMLAPFGHWEPLTLLPYIGYFFYKFLCLFNPRIDLMQAVSFAPFLIVAVSLALYLWLCRLLGCRIFISFCGSVFFLLLPIFLKRSALGWYDNDPYNVLFALLVLTSLFAGLSRLENLKQCLFFAALCAFFLGLYSLFWQGWVYLWVNLLLTAAAAVVLSYFFIRQKKGTRNRNLALFFLVILAGSFLWVSATFGIRDFFILFAEGWRALKNFLTPQLSLWPDLFIGVGELRKMPLHQLVAENGGIFFFVFAAIGFLLSWLKALRPPRSVDPLKLITLSSLLLSCLALTLGAQRFALLLALPLSIFFTLGLQLIYNILHEKFLVTPMMSKRNLLFFRAVIITAVGIMFFTSARHAHKEMFFWQPIFNETWDKALTKIRTETPPESIINTWWPPGHFITSMAQRRVIFDGATINNPQAYWLANLFLSPDEKFAAGTLRMLNNSANQSTEYLQKHGMKLSDAIHKIKEITSRNSKHARIALKNFLSDQETDELLKLTHSDPAPAYVLVYSDLIEKNLELGFVGRWNFELIEKTANDKNAVKNLPSRTSPEFIQFLWKSIGGPLNYSEILSPIAAQGDNVLLSGGISVNTSDMTCQISSKKFGKGIPQNLVYLENNELVEKRLPNANLLYSVILFKENGVYNAMVVDPRLANSLIFRLYFFEGKGLKYFEPFLKEADLTKRTKIFVYKVDWQKFKADLEKP